MTGYVTNVAVTAMLCGWAELLIPESRLKKAARICAGFVLAAALLAPLGVWMNTSAGDFDAAMERALSGIIEEAEVE